MEITTEKLRNEKPARKIKWELIIPGTKVVQEKEKVEKISCYTLMTNTCTY